MPAENKDRAESAVDWQISVDSCSLGLHFIDFYCPNAMNGNFRRLYLSFHIELVESIEEEAPEALFPLAAPAIRMYSYHIVSDKISQSIGIASFNSFNPCLSHSPDLCLIEINV